MKHGIELKSFESKAYMQSLKFGIKSSQNGTKPTRPGPIVFSLNSGQ